MSGLFRRNRRTRAAAAEESRLDPPAPSEPQDATTTAERPGGGSLLVDPAADQPLAAEPSPLAAMHDLPAGLEVDELRSPRPATERRSRLRRRTRYLRRVRELLLRDLGGLVYEIHRSTGGDRAHYESLVHAKAQRLAALDAELFALEDRLGGGHPETVLREPGVGGVCPACGELHASHAHFCSACGTRLTGRAPAVEPTPVAAEEPAPVAAEPAPVAAEPEPATGSDAATEAQRLGEPPTEEPRVDEPRTEEPSTEEAGVDAPRAEEPRMDAPRTEEPGSDAPRPGEPGGEGRDSRYTTNGREASNRDLATPAERPS